MAFIHQVASSFLPEKLAGRAALSSEGCEDMGGTMGAVGAGPAVGAGDMESGGASGDGVKGCSGWGFLGRQGQVAEVRTFSTGASSSLKNDRPKCGLLGLLVVAGVGPSPEEVGPGRFSIFCYA